MRQCCIFSTLPLLLGQLIVRCDEWNAEACTKEEKDFGTESGFADTLVLKWHVLSAQKELRYHSV